MNVTVIHGSPRKGNTYEITEKFKKEMQTQGEVSFREFFLPKDMPEFCKGCFTCILRDEKACPHASFIQPILEAMLEADALIFTTPVYVMSATGAMKAFLDHFGFMFYVHRARPEMFHKKAFILSTTAGAGTKSAMKTIAASLKYWGINRVYSRGFVMHSIKWNQMPDKKKNRYERMLRSDAVKFYHAVASKKDKTPYLHTRFMVFMCRQFQKRADDGAVDKEYWKEQGWLDGNSPFRTR
jgi:multimeric flavodoxin WrbA